MEIKYEIDDKKLQTFTDKAKSELIKQSTKHSLDIINEAKRIEGSLHEQGATQEITENIILQAVRAVRNRLPKKSKCGIIVLRIVLALLLPVLGNLWKPEAFVENLARLYWFCGVFSLVVILTAIVHFKEGN